MSEQFQTVLNSVCVANFELRFHCSVLDISLAEEQMTNPLFPFCFVIGQLCLGDHSSCCFTVFFFSHLPSLICYNVWSTEWVNRDVRIKCVSRLEDRVPRRKQLISLAIKGDNNVIKVVVIVHHSVRQERWTFMHMSHDGVTVNQGTKSNQRATKSDTETIDLTDTQRH